MERKESELLMVQAVETIYIPEEVEEDLTN